MEKIILYVDDPGHAREFLERMAASEADVGVCHWVLVACAPRMTHRISKWVSHSARENWRGKWFAKVQEQLLPLLQQQGSQVTPILAKGPLTELTKRLKLEHGTARVVDARRPKVGVDLEPVAPDPAPPGQSSWALPGALLGMGALLMLAGEMSD
ncbi:hypothetical protein ACQ858_22840 [Variovorax ureilyticus]|uniref:hypothetical protein n=1 Tax=Variovorax ureilyticus TaxID=1836198 RepID=UPI003D66963B